MRPRCAEETAQKAHAKGWRTKSGRPALPSFGRWLRGGRVKFSGHLEMSAKRRQMALGKRAGGSVVAFKDLLLESGNRLLVRADLMVKITLIKLVAAL